MCFHRWQYVGYIEVQRWLLGVAGGIPVDDTIKAKQCQKCGKIKEVD